MKKSLARPTAKIAFPRSPTYLERYSSLPSSNIFIVHKLTIATKVCQISLFQYSRKGSPYYDQMVLSKKRRRHPRIRHADRDSHWSGDCVSRLYFQGDFRKMENVDGFFKFRPAIRSSKNA